MTNNHIFNPQRELRDKPTKQLVRENVDGVLKNKRGPDGKVMYRIVTDKKVDAVWRIPCLQPASKSYLGYPTQKPLALLQRVIKASSNEGDLVLDPFCGCATACVAAEVEGRQWIGIDVSPKAYGLVRSRLKKEVMVGETEQEGDHKSMYGSVIHRADIPSDRDGKLSKDIKHVLYGKQEGLCNGCGVHFPFRNMTKDHIVPTARGGPNTDDNLQLLCGACNSMKGAGTQEQLLARLQQL